MRGFFCLFNLQFSAENRGKTTKKKLCDFIKKILAAPTPIFLN